MKKLLLISYYFPPIQSPESTITSNLVKYLPQFGWAPIVLSIKPSIWETIDNSTTNIPTNINIYRTNSLLRMIIFIYIRIRTFLSTYSNETNILKNYVGDKKTFKNNNKIAKILKYLRILPSRAEGWLPFLIVVGIQILKKDSPEIILSRSTPVTSHIGAFILKYFTGIPWIACFSDPWTTDPNYPYKNKIIPEKLLKQYDDYLERKIIFKADKVIFTTRHLKEEYVQKYKCFRNDKFTVIPNSYESEQFSKVTNIKQINNIFTITYTGTFGNTRSPEPLFKALRLLQNEVNIYTRINIKLIGGLGNFQHLIQKYGLTDVVRVIDKLPHSEIFHHLHSSDALLLIDAPNHTMCLPSKLIEYISIGKPIIAITPEEGSSADVVRATKTGIVVSPSNILGIKEVIKNFYNNYERGNLVIKPDWDEINKYSAENCTKELVKIIDGLMDRQKL